MSAGILIQEVCGIEDVSGLQVGSDFEDGGGE